MVMIQSGADESSALDWDGEARRFQAAKHDAPPGGQMRLQNLED